MNRATIVLTLLAGVAAATPVHAAPGCTGLVTNLPATLSTPGVWCLGEDLGTMVASGYAVRIAASNVTLDCQGFRISGLAAGDATQTVGVLVADKSNAVIRGCNVRGFHTGIGITGGLGGHVVEDNRLDGATVRGILVDGDAAVVRGNRVVDVGGSTTEPGRAWGIVAAGRVDLEDNLVDGVAALPNEFGNSSGTGLLLDNAGYVEVERNRVRGIVSDGDTLGFGVRVLGTPGALVRDNVIGDADVGVSCVETGSVALGNDFSFVTIPLAGCRDDGNRTTP
jgi:nitrous oxidase accessory protein NosD